MKQPLRTSPWLTVRGLKRIKHDPSVESRSRESRFRTTQDRIQGPHSFWKTLYRVGLRSTDETMILGAQSETSIETAPALLSSRGTTRPKNQTAGQPGIKSQPPVTPSTIESDRRARPNQTRDRNDCLGYGSRRGEDRDLLKFARQRIADSGGITKLEKPFTPSMEQTVLRPFVDRTERTRSRRTRDKLKEANEEFK